MFKKTKIRLVLLNTIVLFFVFCIFSLVLYGYMNHIVMTDVSDKLRTMCDEMQHEGIDKVISEHDQMRESERSIGYLLWGANDHYIKAIPEKAVFANDLDDLKPSKYNNQTVVKRVINGHTYAILNIPASTIKEANAGTVKTLQLVLNIDTETNMLGRLFLIIVAGGMMSIAVFVLVGIFLARRSLIPIQKAWEKQTQFVADASHELRTPLSVIQTHLELLFRHPKHTIEQESVSIYKVLQETKRVNKLIADLLTLARSDSNELQIVRENIVIDEFINVIVEQFKPIAEVKGITLQVKMENDLHISADKERLHQLFVILLDNAIKYNKENGSVDVKVKKEGKSAVITISDTGIGIAPDDLAHIFDRFYRGDKSRNRSIGGTGLGLSIAKWIVEAHNGEINAESEPLVGTSITIKLPYSNI
ncbi:sensor histidine kinase [Ectobacillus polymachus]|uniref:sensor histidine kinase n=1 Tax=Ectobacillus polymachus TaxID=1508806 RepID=UPI003A89967A